MIIKVIINKNPNMSFNKIFQSMVKILWVNFKNPNNILMKTIKKLKKKVKGQFLYKKIKITSNQIILL